MNKILRKRKCEACDSLFSIEQPYMSKCGSKVGASGIGEWKCPECREKKPRGRHPKTFRSKYVR